MNIITTLTCIQNIAHSVGMWIILHTETNSIKKINNNKGIDEIKQNLNKYKKSVTIACKFNISDLAKEIRNTPSILNFKDT